MVDVEKELGPLFEKFDKERKIMAKEHKVEKGVKDEFNEFKDICDTAIAPVMRKYQEYLQKKDIYSNIVREPKLGSRSLRKPSISFLLTDSSIISWKGAYPSIRFSPEDGKILETIQGKTTFSIEYSKDQITQDLVASKLTNLIKSCFEQDR